MKCPVCGKKVVLKGEDLTSGRNEKQYNRTIYSCEKCDTWISVEVPINDD